MCVIILSELDIPTSYGADYLSSLFTKMVFLCRKILLSSGLIFVSRAQQRKFFPLGEKRLNLKVFRPVVRPLNASYLTMLSLAIDTRRICSRSRSRPLAGANSFIPVFLQGCDI